MKIENDNLMRQAYQDGQLSVEQVIEYEQQLSSEDKVEIAEEQRFEAAITERLKKDTQCPDMLWQDLKSRLDSKSTKVFQLSNMRWDFLRPVMIAAVACLALIGGGSYFVRLFDFGEEKIAIQFNDDLSEFAQATEIPGDYEKIRSSLTQNGFHIHLNRPDPDADHHVELLGVRYHNIDGEKLAQVYLSCCKRPMAVFLAEKNTKVLPSRLQIMNKEKKMYSIQDEIDNFRLFIVGPHPPDDVLDLFS